MAESPNPSRWSLTTLPDEVQQYIYRHVYPVTDITLRPDDNGLHVRKSLTQDFNIIGNHSVDLLLTCSKVCAVAKPLRDSSFTGRVNVSRARDLAHSGHWLHHNLTKLRFLAPKPTTETRFALTSGLITNLCHVEIVNSEIISQLTCQGLDTFTPLDWRYDHKCIENAEQSVAAFFNDRLVRAFNPDKQMEVIVRQRYLVSDAQDPASHLTLGTVARLSCDGSQIITRVINDGTLLTYWEADACADLSSTPLHKAPTRYLWVKFGHTSTRWEDLNDEDGHSNVIV